MNSSNNFPSLRAYLAPSCATPLPKLQLSREPTTVIPPTMSLSSELIQLLITPQLPGEKELVSVSIVPITPKPVLNPELLALLYESIEILRDIEKQPETSNEPMLERLAKNQRAMSGYVDEFLKMSKEAGDQSSLERDVSNDGFTTPRVVVSIAHVVHELRQPLNIIRNTIPSFFDPKLDRGDVPLLFGMLDEAYKHMHNIVKNIKGGESFVVQSLDLSNFTIRKLMQMITNLTENLAKDDKVTLVFSDDLGTVNDTILRGDLQKIEQILVNLISNAIKYANPKPGSVEISFKLKAKDKEVVAIQFGVKNQGDGIPLEKQKTLFKDFSQLEKATNTNMTESTGLGLSLSQQYAQMMGTKIQIESEVGKETFFHFTLPLKKVGISPGVVRSPLPETRQIFAQIREGMKMLIAEDSDSSIKMYARRFKPAALTIVPSGEDAIEVYKQAHPYQVVILDMNLKGKLTGWQTAERINEICPARIYLCTGDFKAEQLLKEVQGIQNPKPIEALMQGIKIVGKPLDMNALILELNELTKLE